MESGWKKLTMVSLSLYVSPLPVCRCRRYLDCFSCIGFQVESWNNRLCYSAATSLMCLMIYLRLMYQQTTLHQCIEAKQYGSFPWINWRRLIGCPSGQVLINSTDKYSTCCLCTRPEYIIMHSLTDDFRRYPQGFFKIGNFCKSRSRIFTSKRVFLCLRRPDYRAVLHCARA